jgi:putative oxidoreductase
VKNITNIGRFIFSVPFLAFGLMHFMNAEKITAMVPTFMPAASVWVYVIGLAQLGFVASIITKKMLGISGLFAGIMLILFVLIVHIPNMSNPDEMIKTIAIEGMLKDLGLAGGAFVLSGIYSKEMKD